MAISIDINAICPDKKVEVFKYDVIDKVTVVFEDSKILKSSLQIKPFASELHAIIAACDKIDDNSYSIVINKTKAKAILNGSWLSDTVSYDVFETALMLHELAHVKYTDFTKSEDASEMERIVRNIIEDTRIEYRMSYEFPETSVFFNIVCSVLYTTFHAKVIPNASMQEVKDLASLTQELFSFARYNIISNNQELMSEIIPLVLMARRGTFKDCAIASEIIAKLLEKRAIKDKSGPFGKPLSETSRPVDEEARKQIVNQAQNDIASQEMANRFFNKDIVVEKIKKTFKEVESTAGSVISVQNKEKTPFFVNTAIQHRREIEQLHDLFKKAFSDYKNVSAKDGDLDFMKQQSAYINSITGEEGKDYMYRKFERVLVDVVILRDISGSVNTFKVDYAKSIIIFLAALENIPGIRTAQIDFNGRHFVNKTFDTPIEKAEINPVADGGTYIISAYEEVLTYQFKGKKNLVVVFSDGDFYDPNHKVNALEKEISKVAKIIKLGIGGYSRNNFYPIEVKDIPKEMTKILMREGLGR